MSDPVTNVEIEDVLSSIRRLVSADDREHTQRQGESRATKEEREAKLVLTPAQRVDEQDEEVASAEIDIEAPEEHAYDESRFDGIEDAELVESRSAEEDADEDAYLLKDLPQFIHRGMDERMADPQPERDKEEPETLDMSKYALADDEVAGEDADETTADEWDDLEEDAALVSETADDQDLSEAEAEAEAEDAAVEDAGEIDLAQDDEDTGEIDLKALEARIAGFETAVAEQDEQWEPDGSSEDDYAAGPQSPLPWQDVDEDEGAQQEPGKLRVDADEPDFELERQVDREDDTFEDAQVASGGDDSGLARDNQTTRSERDGGSWYSDDAILDEDALRDMVSEIVRQELQGALGERITRNVRKLVRREIHRALMSQGID